MFNSLSKKTYFEYSLFLLPVGLLFGEVPTSISEFIIAGTFLLQDNIAEKFKRLYHSKFFWICISVYLLHLFGLTYTSDFIYAFHDLNIKVPLLLFPILLFAADMMSNKVLFHLLNFFIFVVFINLSFLCLNYFIHYEQINEIRDASIFISHIRLGLISALGLLYVVFLPIILKPKNYFLYIIAFILIFTEMLYLGLVSGLVAFFTVLIFSSIVFLIQNRLYKKLLIFFCFIGLILLTIGYYVYHIKQFYLPNKINNYSLLSTTSNHNLYTNDTTYQYQENGNLVFINICNKELSKEWNKRSTIQFDSLDKKGNQIKYTLYRYLSSKGIAKDSIGIAHLNQQDIANIEKGYPNYYYATTNALEKKTYELLMERNYYKGNRDASGKTLTLREVYWQNAWYIWKQYFLFGVGTGDVQQAYKDFYTNHTTNLNKKFQLRAHNQFLTIGLTFGIIGLLIFLFFLIYLLIKTQHSSLFILYFTFWCIMFLSFFIDDTLETQAGATFVAFFNTLLIKFISSEREK